MYRLFATPDALLIESNGRWLRPTGEVSIDTLFTAENPAAFVANLAEQASETGAPDPAQLRAPLGAQEIWAAGVTYLRSKDARREESKDAGGGDFYDKVYAADRPELFFKATPHRVAHPGAGVRIRKDSLWNVPEPELTLAINAEGRIFGYTVGNDKSSRDIEGANPLYLPQAKVYDRSAAIGPCLLVCDPLPESTVIHILIRRAAQSVFEGSTEISQIKRSLPSLADWLYKENAFPFGAYLMTGTGIVPPDRFTLQSGDEIRITIDPIGTLVNSVI
ncbi:MAG: fumarylacetoacetate hydrolase family protein [Puniceicoccaceae bacterium]